MSIIRSASIVCFGLLSLFECDAQEQTTRSKLKQPEVQMPEVIRSDFPNFLFVGVEVSGNYFYYFGGQRQRIPMKLQSLDTLVKSHQKTKDAALIVRVCGSPIHDNLETLMLRLERLGVKEFTVVDKEPCEK